MGVIFIYCRARIITEVVNTLNTLQEKRSVMALAAIMSIRMLGLFMILPVFSVYASQMPGATPTLIGLGLGIYGLTQACLQIPFGMTSDYIGRKPVIALGLCLLLIGSVIAALSHTITTLILGRALQGAGAVGSTVLALTADLTRDEFRSKAMAMIGLSIGFAFTIAMIFGPLLNTWFHLSGIFWATALLAVAGLCILLFAIPTPPRPITTPHTTIRNRFSTAFTQKLLLLDISIFSLHAILTAMFIAIPFVLFHTIGLTEWQQVGLYLSVLIFSFAAALPLIIIAEKKRRMKPIFMGAIAVIFGLELILSFAPHTILLTCILLFIFFTAFTFLEATLPSWVSKIAPLRHKGAAMGVYSSSQFLGIFVGGALGGFIYAHAHQMGVFLLCAFIALIWLIISKGLGQPPYLSTLVFKLKATPIEANLQQQLSTITGIAEIAAIPQEGLLYIKIDKQKISENELREVLRQSNLTS